MPAVTAQASGRSDWYMSPGIVAESDLSGNLQSEYVFFDGERVARKNFPSNAVSYYFSDHLKTASVITDSAGNIKEDEDYYPWGGEIPFVNGDSNHYKFTGKERDTETGLDYFGARYYSNPLGRWLTPDWAAKPITVPYANFGNPQSLNLYTYGKNNPRTFGDPDGHDPADGPRNPATLATGPILFNPDPIIDTIESVVTHIRHALTSGPPQPSTPDAIPPGSCVCPPNTYQNNDSKQNNNNSQSHEFSPSAD